MYWSSKLKKKKKLSLLEKRIFFSMAFFIVKDISMKLSGTEKFLWVNIADEFPRELVKDFRRKHFDLV